MASSQCLTIYFVKYVIFQFYLLILRIQIMFPDNQNYVIQKICSCFLNHYLLKKYNLILCICRGQGGLACCDSWGRKKSDTTERLN